MEVYVAPGTDPSSAPLTRASLLCLLQEHGLNVTPADQGQRHSSGRFLWTLEFPGSDVRILFQEDQGILVFATIEQSMFNATDVPDRICAALESAGWQTDDENVG